MIRTGIIITQSKGPFKWYQQETDKAKKIVSVIMMVSFVFVF